jgi:putative DNA primase/helicase
MNTQQMAAAEISSEEFERIVLAAASTQDALDALALRIGAEEVDSETLMRITAVRHSRPIMQPPAPENFTTFAPPPIVDPYVARIHSEATRNACYTHADAAEIFARWHRGWIWRCKETGHWLAWDGKVWLGNAQVMVRDALANFLSLYSQAALLEFEGQAGRTQQKIINNAGFRRGAWDFLETKQDLAIAMARLDADPWALNTPGGIVDLRTGEMRAHDPAALCTKITRIAPMPRAEFDRAFAGSRFARFLREIFQKVPDAERDELIRFEQQTCGYCFTADTTLHFLKFWYGEGRNGKSTLGELLLHVAGNYGKKINNTLMMSSKNDRHPTELANLVGLRFAVCSEISEGAYINEALVKELTGDSELSARFMHQDFFTFTRSQKHLIYGNSKPRLRIADAAIRSRMKLTPFEMNFEEAGLQDTRLKSELIAESPLVLAWLIEGVGALHASGMVMPESRFVLRQTEEYMDENDVIQIWLDERCIHGQAAVAKAEAASVRTRSSELYADYRKWRQARGEHPESIQRWTQLMVTRGFRRAEIDGYMHFYEIDLRFVTEPF